MKLAASALCTMNPTDFFVAPFGGTRLEQNSEFRLRGGLTRQHDHIFAKVIEDATQLYGKARALVLNEGTTWPEKAIHGSPWFSRRISQTLPMVEVTACDRTIENLDTAIICRNPEGEISYHVVFHEKGSRVGHTSLRSFDGRVRSVEFTLNEAINAIADKECRLDIKNWIKQDESRGSAQSRFFLRPIIDRDLERLVFGVKAVGGVDILAKMLELPQSSFDVIVGHHQSFGSCSTEFEQIRRALRPLLRENGRAKIYFFRDPSVPGEWLTIERLMRVPRLRDE